MGAHLWPPTSLPDVAVRLAAIDASFGRALQLLDNIASDDGALSIAAKDLLGVAMTALEDPQACRATTERAVGSGAGPAELRAVAQALYLSRGERPAGVVLDAADDVLATDPDDAGDAAGPPPTVPPEEIAAEFAAVFGELPARVRLLQQYAPAGLEAYHRMRVGVLRDGALDPQLAELILFAVNAMEHRADYATVHARGARLAGAGDAELVEAGLCTIRYGGVAAWLAASEAIEATRQAKGGSDDGAG